MTARELLHGMPPQAVPAAGAALEVRDLRMRYGAVDVLDGVGFTAGRGQVLALLGPNGAGKTTTIEILEGFRMRSADLDDTTILLSTHDLDEAEKLADRIVILAGGRIIADGSADELSRRMSTGAEVRWTRDGQRFVHATADATGYVRELFAQYGEAIGDLEVRRASLEDTYMATGTPGRDRYRRGRHGRPPVNPTLAAVRAGLVRGRIELAQTFTNVQDLWTYLFPAVTLLSVMVFLRGHTIAGTGLSLGTRTLPGAIGMAWRSPDWSRWP